MWSCRPDDDQILVDSTITLEWYSSMEIRLNAPGVCSCRRRATKDPLNKQGRSGALSKEELWRISGEEMGWRISESGLWSVWSDVTQPAWLCQRWACGRGAGRRGGGGLRMSLCWYFETPVLRDLVGYTPLQNDGHGQERFTSVPRSSSFLAGSCRSLTVN